jgi:uncharacterized protein (TIGR02246 family)
MVQPRSRGPGFYPQVGISMRASFIIRAGGGTDAPMRNRNISMKASILASTATLILAAMLNSVVVAAEMSPAEQAIRKEAKEFADAYNRGNAEAIAAQWTKDGEYIIGQQTIRGRDAIAKLYKAFLRAHPGSKMDVKVESVRSLAPTVALEEGTASVSGSPNGPPSSSSYSAVHVKQGDEWLMVSVRESEMPTVQLDRDLKELDWMVGKWSASKDDTKVTLACDWMIDKHFLRANVTVQGKSGQIPGGTQIIGRDPVTGQIVSWFFSVDGGYGSAIWQKDGSRWMIQTRGIASDGTPTAATNMLYRADKNVASWQSANRFRGDMSLPDIKEVVIERAPEKK